MADSDKVPPVSDQDFDAQILKADLPTLVDFWAVWCGPCKMVAPVVEELATDFAGRIGFAKMNVDENLSTPPKYGIRGIPTLLLFKGGEVVDQIVGAVPKGKVKEMLEKHL